MTLKKIDTGSLLTAEDMWEMPEVPGKQFELVRGELVEVPRATGKHGLLVRTICLLLHPFVVARDLGEVFMDGVSYIIGRDPDTVRVPDVSFISKARIPEGGIPDTYMPMVPDLTVEIVSSGDRAVKVYDKVHQYLDGGARLVWVLWPTHRSITVYSSAGAVRELGEGDELDGGDVLPGFRVRVAEIFKALG